MMIFVKLIRDNELLFCNIKFKNICVNCSSLEGIFTPITCVCRRRRIVLANTDKKLQYITSVYKKNKQSEIWLQLLVWAVNHLKRVRSLRAEYMVERMPVHYLLIVLVTITIGANAASIRLPRKNVLPLEQFKTVSIIFILRLKVVSILSSYD